MNSSAEESSNSDFIAPVQCTLFFIIFLAAIVGNGVFLFLFIRNKTLRTVHHALFTDLSIIDLLNSAINIPLSVCYVVYDIASFRNKTFAWTVSFLQVFFALLSLSSMALQMIDRYLAVCWPIFYKTGKLMAKIIVVIIVKWLVILTIVLLIYVPLYDVDLGHSLVLEYRELYSKKSRQKLSRYVTPVLILTILLFGSLSLWYLRKRPGQLDGAVQNLHNSPNRRAKKKAVRTVLILLTVILISFLPAAINARLLLGHDSQTKFRIAFAILFSLNIPSAVNPFVVLFRVKCFSDKLGALKNDFQSLCCTRETHADVENVGENSVRNEKAKSSNFQAGEFELYTIYRDKKIPRSRSLSCPDISFPQKTEKERRKSF